MTVAFTPRPARNARQILADAATVAAPALREAARALAPAVWDLVALHFGWLPPPGPGGGSHGKAVRPALALASCAAMGGREEAALPAAVAVELVHNASLLHDDIIDGDRLRRGRVALWAHKGLPAGILAGDALFFLAIQAIASAPEPLGARGARILTAAVQDLIDGEWADVCLEQCDQVSVAECETTAAAKTAALTAAACELGALAAQAGPARAKRMRAFGHHLGVAVQFTDDILGIWGDPTVTGKPALSDLRYRKKSLPVAYALASATPAGEELRRRYRQAGALDEGELPRCAQLIDTTGARSWARAAATSHAHTALEELHAAHPAAVAEEELSALAQLVISRNM